VAGLTRGLTGYFGFMRQLLVPTDWQHASETMSPGDSRRTRSFKFALFGAQIDDSLIGRQIAVEWSSK
jgi:hypothetical protein